MTFPPYQKKGYGTLLIEFSASAFPLFNSDSVQTILSLPLRRLRALASIYPPLFHSRRNSRTPPVRFGAQGLLGVLDFGPSSLFRLHLRRERGRRATSAPTPATSPAAAKTKIARRVGRRARRGCAAAQSESDNASG